GVLLLFESEFETKQTSPQEDRWGDSGEIPCRSNFLFTRGIRAVRGGATTAPLFSRIHTSLISVWRAISRAQVEVRPQWENGAPNNAPSQTKKERGRVRGVGGGGRWSGVEGAGGARRRGGPDLARWD
uniref:Uncharacterized protein ycf68 n=1 Tax=Aegilops tauschii subsp. strangulata TaxID=200361 RepID=A0A452XCV0_AEGTS